jgi:hypothetical protein
MRPRTSDTDKLNEGIRVRLTTLEKKLLVQRSKREGYRTVSDFCRAKLVRKREIRKIEVSNEFKEITLKLDYDLNKIGVNLNQLAKKVNSFYNYRLSDADQALLLRILQELDNCFSVLQRYMDKIDS